MPLLSKPLGAAVLVAVVFVPSVAFSEDSLKLAVGAPQQLGRRRFRNRSAGRHLHRRHGPNLEILYTNGGGETMPAVISGSVESTYLAAGSADIKTLADVDRPEITVVGIAGSSTMRAAGRSLKTAKIVPAKSVDEAMAMMRTGSAQAFALTHDALPPLQKQPPGSRILDGAFQTTGVAVAVQKNRPAALAYVKDFIESAKANGIVRRAFDDAGLNQLPIAP
jgi:ABC-type amino acid transport substrate-binding protein